MYKVGLIGLGNVGFRYLSADGVTDLTHFEAIASNPDLHLIYGVDPVRPANWPKSKKYFSEVKNIDVSCDLAVIACPTQTHLRIFEELCDSNTPPRSVLLEKPAGDSLSTISKIREISEVNSIPVYVNFFRDCDIDIIQNILKHETVTHVEIRYTGTLLNIGYHFLHFVKSILDEKIRLIKKENFYEYTIYFCELSGVDLIAVERKNVRIPENQIIFYTKNSKIIYDNENNVIKTFNIKSSNIYVDEDIFHFETVKSANLHKGFMIVYRELVSALCGHTCRLPTVADIENFREEFEND